MVADLNSADAAEQAKIVPLAAIDKPVTCQAFARNYD